MKTKSQSCHVFWGKGAFEPLAQAAGLSWPCLLVSLLLTSGIGLVAQPVIDTQPQNQTNVLGSTATFTVEATGAPPLTYQWRDYTSATIFTDIERATNATLVLTNVQRTSHRFGVLVSNPEGSTLSTLARLIVLVPPTITQQPVNLTVDLGQEATFNVVAESVTQPLAYQWQFNGMDLPEATNDQLLVPDAQLSDTGDYRVVVSNAAGAVTSQTAALTVIKSPLIRITTGPVVNDNSNSSPGKWGDYDNDGHIDLFVGQSFFYHNNGDGTFSRVTLDGIGVLTSARASQWVDYNNDGLIDFMSRAGQQMNLFQNLGNSQFQRVILPPITTDFADGRGNGWADFDNDGDLDYFRSNTYYQNDFLYRNDGNGMFTRILDSPVVRDQARAYTCKWVDYDNDGAMDLYMADAGSFGGFLYNNRGDGTFVPVTFADTRLFNHGISTHAAWGDYDNDGDLDVYITNRGYGGGDSYNPLFRNNGDGTFAKLIDAVPAQDFASTWGAGWGDYDNDGHLDLFVSAGRNWGVDRDQDNYLYHNEGDGTFTRVTTGRVANDGGVSWGCSWGDYDNDGFLDLFVANDEGQNDFLYRNAGNSNAWLMLKLVGAASNRSAVGARIHVRAVINGAERWQMREVPGGGFSYGQPDPRMHFGLGDATQVDLIRIEWPSGILQQLTNVTVRQVLTVNEAIPDEITIVFQPQSTTAEAGRPAKLFAKVSGPPPLTFQWQHEGVAMPGAIHRILYLTNAQPSHAGLYRLVVSGPPGTVTSEEAILTVTPPLQPGPRQFTGIAPEPDGSVRVGLAGGPSHGMLEIYHLESSTNLSTWTPLSPVVSGNEAAQYVDTNATVTSQRYFRVKEKGFWTPYAAPTGPHAVGTFRRQAPNPLNANRPTVMTVWYPGRILGGEIPVPWFEGAYVTYLMERFGRGMTVLSNLHGHAIEGLPPAPGGSRWPVLIYSHAYKEGREVNRDLCEELASHGYIVVAINHRDAELTILDDGTLVPGSGQWGYSGLFGERVRDCQFAYDQLALWDETDPVLAGRVDLSSMGALGFSLGGETAAQLGRQDGRCQAVAVIGMEPFWAFHLATSGPVGRPLLLLMEEPAQDTVNAGDIQNGNPAFSLYNMVGGPAYYMRIKGTMHLSLGGFLRVVAPDVPAAFTDNRRAAQIVNACVVSFFDKHIKGQDNQLLDDPRPDFPEIDPFLQK